MLDLAMVLNVLRERAGLDMGIYDILKVGYDAENDQLVAFGRSNRDYVIGIGVFLGCDCSLAWAYGHYHDDIEEAQEEYEDRCKKTVWVKG